MALWTPNSLTDPGFVAKLSPSDRNFALYNQQQSLTTMKSALERNQAEQLKVLDELNSKYSFQDAKAAKRELEAAQKDPNLTTEQKAAAQAKYEEFTATRAELSNRNDQLERAIEGGKTGIERAETGITILQSQGAVPESALTSPAPEPSSPQSQQSGEPPGEKTDTTPVLNASPNNSGAGTEPQQEAFLRANQEPAGGGIDAPPVVVTATDPEREAFLLANQADEGTIQAQKTPSAEESKFAEANADVATGESLDAKDNADETQRLKNRSITVGQERARSEATAQDQTNFRQTGDWRVRLSLASQSNYLYNLPNDAGILAPLKATNGVIFPYTPTVNVTYNANYDPTDVTHSNYKIYQYRNSSVENISLTCDFTAQDTYEANYLLAVIHFFRTVTKMFYGKDENPKPGTPPPLCYLTGLGAFQFDKHPLAITSFTYSLPTDVDYIRAGTTTTPAGVNKSDSQPKDLNTNTNNRLNNVSPGGQPTAPKFKNVSGGTVEPTYVPTKIQLSVSAIPIMSRSLISNEFSLKNYGTGILLQGSNRRTGGVW